MATAYERFVIYISHPKIKRWVELCKKQERGYARDILTPLLDKFLTTGEIMHIATVNSNNCTSEDKIVASLAFYRPGDTVANAKIMYLRKQKKFNSFLIGLLNQAITEGENENLMSTWDLCVSELSQYQKEIGNESEQDVVFHKKPDLQITDSIQPTAQKAATSNKVSQKPNIKTNQPLESVQHVEPLSVQEEKEEPMKQPMSADTTQQKAFSFASRSSGSKIRGLMSAAGKDPD